MLGVVGAIAGLLWLGAVPAAARAGTLTATGTFGVERLTIRLR